MSGRLIRAIVWYPWPNNFIASLLHLRTYVPFGSSFCVVVDRNTSLPYHWHPRNLLSFCQSCSSSSNSFHLWKFSSRAAGKFSTNSLPPPTYLNVLQISQLNLAIRSTIWRHHYFRALWLSMSHPFNGDENPLPGRPLSQMNSNVRRLSADNVNSEGGRVLVGCGWWCQSFLNKYRKSISITRRDSYSSTLSLLVYLLHDPFTLRLL